MTTINTHKMQTAADKKAFLELIKALNEANQYSRRHDYAYRHSNGRTESTKELTTAECYAVIRELGLKYGFADANNTMRRKIISFAHQMGWQIGIKADMKRINRWCVEHGPYKKELNKHDGKELGILVGVFQKMYKQYLNKI